MTSPGVDAAIGPAVEAAVQASLAPAVGAAVTAAMHGPYGGRLSRHCEGCCHTRSWSFPDPHGLQEVVQTVRSTVGQLVKVVQTAIKEASTVECNAVAAAHNQVQVVRCGYGKLLPRKNCAGELPPSGLFPTSVDDLQKLVKTPCSSGIGTDDVERNARIFKLHRFYGTHVNGKPYPVSDHLPREGARDEFIRRASHLQAALQL